MSIQLVRRLLIVEDDLDRRSTLRDAAARDERFGAVVDFGDVPEAITAASPEWPFDAVILGHDRDSGFGALSTLRSLLPDATIVLHTSDLPVLAMALLAGADDVLAKGEQTARVLDAAAGLIVMVDDDVSDAEVINLRENHKTIDIRENVPVPVEVADHDLIGFAFGPSTDPFVGLCGCGWRSGHVADPAHARAQHDAHRREVGLDERATTDAADQGSAGPGPQR